MVGQKTYYDQRITELKVPMTKRWIDVTVMLAKNQSEIILALYRLMPPFEYCTQMKGHPRVSKVTSSYLFDKCIEFDKKHHPKSMAGGLLMNNGPSTLDSEDIPDWELHFDESNFIMPEEVK